MSSNSYLDTRLVEANRLHSLEFNGGNELSRAQWTNKIGSGIQLNPGDTFQLHSAYISQKGAEAQTIEFKGEFIEKKTFIESQLFVEDFNGSSDVNASRTINQYNIERYTNASVEKDLFDNKTTISLSYYINNNCMNSVMLPRRHFAVDANGVPTPTFWNYMFDNGFPDSIEKGLPERPIWLFYKPDYKFNTYLVDQPGYTQTDGNEPYKLKVDNSRFTLFVKEDTYFATTSATRREELNIPGVETVSSASGSTELTLFFDTDSKMNPDLYSGIFVTDTADPPRFTNAYVISTVFDEANSSQTITIDTPINRAWNGGDEPTLNAFFYTDKGYDETTRVSALQGPCGYDYIPYKQLTEIELPVGKNSPSDISTRITEQLSVINKTSDFYKIGYNGSDEAVEEFSLSRYVESELYKPFNCASIGQMSKNNFINYYNNASIYNASYQGAVDYLSAYQFVGYKRPEIQETGRALMKKMSEDKTTTTAARNKGTKIIDTTIDGYYIIQFEGLFWREDYLLKFKEFIESQELYPDLFKTSNMNSSLLYPHASVAELNSSNARFFYVNSSNVAPYNEFLGYDGNASGTDSTTMRHLAVPFWFEYNASYKDTFNDTVNDFSGDATYGCLYKVANGNDASFPEYQRYSAAVLIDKFSYPKIFEAEGFPNLTGYKAGFDFSFRAYGTAALLLFNGWGFGFPDNLAGINGCQTTSEGGIQIPGTVHRVTYKNANLAEFNQDDFTQFDINASNSLYSADELRKIYVGANQPTFGYSPQENRFFWSLLHTPMRNEQKWNTGFSASAPSDSGQQAYANVVKFNPSDLPHNYTPDREPYQFPVRKYPSQTTSDTNFYTAYNRNLEEDLGYDAYCGISIDDMGYTPDQNLNTLWSILGFPDSQIYNTKNSSNTISSLIVNDTNKNRLSSLVTNADFDSDITPRLNTNCFESTLASQHVASQFLQVNGEIHGGIKIVPPVTIGHNSIELTAQNLPSTVLRPYYLIKSSLIDTTSYLGQKDSGIPANIIGIVSKLDQSGDFYQQSGNFETFTITRPMTITGIFSEICDPDGSVAYCDQASSLIYKFQKQRAIVDVLSDIQQQQQKK